MWAAYLIFDFWIENFVVRQIGHANWYSTLLLSVSAGFATAGSVMALHDSLLDLHSMNLRLQQI